MSATRILGSATLLLALGVAGASAQQRPTSRPAPAARPAARPAPAPRTAPAARPQVGGGYIPSRGPTRSATPTRPAPGRPAPAQADQVRQRTAPHVDGHPGYPHVDATNGRWIGHDAGDRVHYHLDHPWVHGRFPGTLGPRYVYRLSGGSAVRFGFGGYFFAVAPYDMDACADWGWDTDDVVVYDDPDDPGYYLAYNTRLGTYCHVEYLGN